MLPLSRMTARPWAPTLLRPRLACLCMQRERALKRSERISEVGGSITQSSEAAAANASRGAVLRFAPQMGSIHSSPCFALRTAPISISSYRVLETYAPRHLTFPFQVQNKAKRWQFIPYTVLGLVRSAERKHYSSYRPSNFSWVYR